MLYGSDDWAPLSDITLGLLARRAGVQWRYVPLGGLAEIVWPPLCGTYHLHIEHEQTPGEKRFAIRHGLAHVLDGHVAEIAYCHDGHDPLGYQECVADLFAAVDLIPNRAIRELVTAGYTLDERLHWMWCELKRYAPRWPTARIADRVGLRLTFYQMGIACES